MNINQLLPDFCCPGIPKNSSSGQSDCTHALQSLSCFSLALHQAPARVVWRPAPSSCSRLSSQLSREGPLSQRNPEEQTHRPHLVLSQFTTANSAPLITASLTPSTLTFRHYSPPLHLSWHADSFTSLSFHPTRKWDCCSVPDHYPSRLSTPCHGSSDLPDQCSQKSLVYTS